MANIFLKFCKNHMPHSLSKRDVLVAARLSILCRCLLIGVMLLGLPGCGKDKDDNNPTSPALGAVIHRGKTDGGQAFDVVWEESGVLRLRIANGAGTTLNLAPGAPGREQSVAESIKVAELAGSPALWHISWQNYFYSLSTSLYYQYVVVPQEAPDKPLIQQVCSFDFDRHHGFSWTLGKHSIEYRNGVITVVEHWKECFGCGGCGEFSVEEKRLSRSFRLKGSTDLTLVTCEELTRSASGLQCPDSPSTSDKNLEPLPGKWQVTKMSPDDIAKKCVAKDHTYDPFPSIP